MNIGPINIIPENLCFMDFDDEDVQASVIQALVEAINKEKESALKGESDKGENPLLK